MMIAKFFVGHHIPLMNASLVNVTVRSYTTINIIWVYTVTWFDIVRFVRIKLLNNFQSISIELTTHQKHHQFVSMKEQKLRLVQ